MKGFKKYIISKKPFHSPKLLVSNKDVINWDVNKLDEKSNKSHNQKANARGSGNGSEFFTIGLGTFLDKVDRVLGKLTKWLDENFVESFLLSHFC